jgi:glycosyltransferase involved in cell wall biosynthesis
VRDDVAVFEVPRTRLMRALARRGWAGRQAAKALVVLGFLAAIKRALSHGPRVDFMLFRGVPFWYFPLARCFRLQTGVPYVLDLGDVWYMRGLRYRRGQRKGLRHLVDAPAESWSVHGAALTVLTTPEQADVYRRRYPARAGSVVTMRWGYDAALAAAGHADTKEPGLCRVGIMGRFSVYRPDDADGLAEAVAALSEERPVDVVHMGSGEPALVAAFDRAGQASALRCLGMVPYTRCYEVLRSCDCGVASPLSDVSVPVKVYDYLGLRLPVIAFAPAGSAMEAFLWRVPGASVVTDAATALAALRRVASGGPREAMAEFDPSEFSHQHQFGRLVARLREIRSCTP